MATDDRSDGGKILSRLMARRGFSAPEVSRRVEADLGASTVRAYTSGRSKPRPGKAIAIARIFDPEDGAALLRAWGYDDLAEGLIEESDRQEMEFPPRQPPGSVPTVESDPTRRRPPVGTTVTLTVVASGETTGGGALWIAATDQGGLVAVVPLRAVEGLSIGQSG